MKARRRLRKPRKKNLTPKVRKRNLQLLRRSNITVAVLVCLQYIPVATLVCTLCVPVETLVYKQYASSVTLVYIHTVCIFVFQFFCIAVSKIFKLSRKIKISQLLNVSRNLLALFLAVYNIWFCTIIMYLSQKSQFKL